MARPVCKRVCRDRLLISLLQRIRPRRVSPGQDGDTRAPVLIKRSASSAAFLTRLPKRRSTVRSHGGWVCGQSSDRVRSLANHQLEETMLSRTDNTETETSIRTDLRAIFVSLELSRTTWLVTSLSRARGRRCQSTPCRPVILAAFLCGFDRSRSGCGPEGRSYLRWSSSRRPGSRGSGSIEC